MLSRGYIEAPPSGRLSFLGSSTWSYGVGFEGALEFGDNDRDTRPAFGMIGVLRAGGECAEPG
jgi:hypothetical protein